VEESLVVGITAIGFMTLQQVGLDVFRQSPGSVSINRRMAGRSPDRVLRSRQKADAQGIFGILRGDRKVFKVTFDENNPSATFNVINTQELTSASASDKRDYTATDPRCMKGEGPIPIECRSAACGTCWVGVLAGADKLSDVDRFEGRKMKDFGYINTSDRKPIIRLACRAQATGSVSIVIPPWNGVFGKYLAERRTAHSRERQNTNS
jgi:ferredoxin